MDSSPMSAPLVDAELQQQQQQLMESQVGISSPRGGSSGGGNLLASFFVLIGENPQLFLIVVMFGVSLVFVTYHVIRGMLDPSHMEQQHEMLPSSEDDVKILEEKKKSRMNRLLAQLEGCMKVVAEDDIPQPATSDSADIEEEDRMVTVSLSSGGDEIESEAQDSRDISTLCSVCLMQYEANDTIVWSPNPACQHIFHKECILEWLGRGKDRCPCCRHYFVVHEEDSERQRLDSTASDTTASSEDDDNIEVSLV